MKELVRSAFQWLADTRLARRVVDTLFGARARRRIVELDHQSVARCQNRTLLGLVHQGHRTRFGRDHDFRRIRNAGDFRRLVPLRTPGELWREYWQPAYPALAGATWPGPIPYLAISAATSNVPLPYIPVSLDLWATHQTAALTALAFVLHARPRTRLCTGRLCLVGGGTMLSPAGDPAAAESLEAIAFRKLSPYLQPYALTYPALADRDNGQADNKPLVDLAQRCTRVPVTTLAGSADALAALLAHAKRLTGHDCVTSIWPHLAAILYTSSTLPLGRSRLLEEVGDPRLLCLEMVLRPEGAVAIEDPRHRGLRLLPDHGIYFEFVPVDQLDRPRPERLSAAEVKVGVPYALAISSPAGVWACLVGSVVRFERRDPPLLQLVEAGNLWQQPSFSMPAVAEPVTAAHAFPAQPPHRRSAGTPAAHPGTSFRSALSAHAGRE